MQADYPMIILDLFSFIGFGWGSYLAGTVLKSHCGTQFVHFYVYNTCMLE